MNTWKKLILLIFMMNSYCICQRQQHVFIMIDKSASINKGEAAQAKEVLKEILLGKKITNNDFEVMPEYSMGIGNGEPIVSNGSIMSIIPFGDRKTGSTITANMISKGNNEITSLIENKYPDTFKDPYTYITLAQARIALYAQNNNIINYLLIIISDNRKDNGPNLSDRELELVNSLDKKGMEAKRELVASISYIPHKVFQTQFYKWDISKWRKPFASEDDTTKRTFESECEISLLGLSGGKQDKPIAVNKNNITISWSLNCSVSTKYAILISGVDGNDFREKKLVRSNFYSTKLDDGVYRITISGISDETKGILVKPATTFIEVSSSSSFFLFFLIFAIMAGIVVYFMWKNKYFIFKKKPDNNSIQKEW